MASMDKLEGHRWPENSAVVDSLLQRSVNGELEDNLHPILHLSQAANGLLDESRQITGMMYMAYAKKVLVREFWNKEKNEMEGAVLFTRDAAGLTAGEADCGAIASILDNILGVFVVTTLKLLSPTLWFDVEYDRTLPIGVVLKFHCTVLNRIGRRIEVEGRIMDPTGRVACRARGLFLSLQHFPFPTKALSDPMVKAVLSKAPEACLIPNLRREWPPIEKSMVAWLMGQGYRPDEAWHAGPNDSAIRTFEFGFAPKLRMQAFHAPDGSKMCAVIEFTKLACGPPGGANGGAVLCATATSAYHFLARCEGKVTLELLQTKFLKMMPIGHCAMLTCKRDFRETNLDGRVVVDVELSVSSGTDSLQPQMGLATWDPNETTLVSSSKATFIPTRRVAAPAAESRL